MSQGTIADTYVTIGDRTGDQGPIEPIWTALDNDLFNAGESIQTGGLGWHLFPFDTIGSPDSPGLGSADGNSNNAVLILGIAQTAPRLSGTFDVAYTTPDGQLIINSSSITTLLCPADTNADGMLTPADFNAWIIAFNTQSAACDQNGDGLCTPADFNAWILNFNSGC